MKYLQKILLSCCLFFLAVLAHAQTPQYAFIDGHLYNSVEFIGKNTGIKYQCIYYPTDFPGMPAGDVTAIYFRIGNLVGAVDSAVFPFFTVKIGSCKDSTYPNGPGKYDTFKTGLVTAYGPATFKVLHTDSVGRWVKVPVGPGKYKYTPEQKFAVEIASGPKNDETGFWISANIKDIVHKYRFISGPRDSIRVRGAANVTIIDLGLDIGTTGVSNIGNINSFGLFPNPTSDGRFNVSFDAKQVVQIATIAVTNVTGQEIYKQSYSQLGKSFFKEVNLGQAAKGIYFMELVADGERIVRRVVVE